jgi:hypothetical protein
VSVDPQATLKTFPGWFGRFSTGTDRVTQMNRNTPPGLLALLWCSVTATHEHACACPLCARLPASQAARVVPLIRVLRLLKIARMLRVLRLGRFRCADECHRNILEHGTTPTHVMPGCCGCHC